MIQICDTGELKAAVSFRKQPLYYSDITYLQQVQSLEPQLLQHSLLHAQDLLFDLVLESTLTPPAYKDVPAIRSMVAMPTIVFFMLLIIIV